MKNTSLAQATYKTVNIDNVQIFYREAGNSDAETILFLHGFPSSSHMYRDLLNELSDSYHVIAPDYPGFGHSTAPEVSAYDYTFDNLSVTMEKFIDQIGLKKFSLFIQDYGSPVGFRIAVRRPELIQALIIQNANAYLEGLGPMVQMINELETSGDHERLNNATYFMMSYDEIKNMYFTGAKNSEKISPDGYLFDHYLMERPGIKEIQLALFKNYGNNFPLYPQWQQYLRDNQPPALILWGGNDQIFITAGANAYKQDFKNVEVHIFDGSHFAIEEYYPDMAGLIRVF